MDTANTPQSGRTLMTVSFPIENDSALRLNSSAVILLRVTLPEVPVRFVRSGQSLP